MREPTLRERWLNGEDVVYDPCMDVAIEELPEVFRRMDIEQRAWFCGLDDRNRTRYIIHLLREMRDFVENRILYGAPR